MNIIAPLCKTKCGMDAAVYNVWSLLRKLQAVKSAWKPILQQNSNSLSYLMEETFQITPFLLPRSQGEVIYSHIYMLEKRRQNSNQRFALFDMAF